MPDVINRDLTQSGQDGGAKAVLLLKGLCCVSCASMIEREAGDLPEVASASVDFASARLFLEVRDRLRLKDAVEKASQIARRVESGIEVVWEERRERTDADKAAGSARLRFVRIGLGAALFLTALLLELPFLADTGLYLAGYLIVGGDILLRAARNIVRGRVFDENFLMSLATIGAFAIGEFPEGAAVMLFYQIGEMFQDAAVRRSRRSIAALMDIRPDYANLISEDGDVMRVPPEEVAVGARILIKPGEKAPLDGIIIEGRAALDTSALTGESLPRDAGPGDEILSGAINKNGLLTIEMTKTYGESAVSRILELVQNAAAKKAPTESFITKFARYYTPLVVAAAAVIALVPPLVLPGAGFAEWINRALVFLVVSCPCALVISIPLGFFGGIGGASRNGILIKGGNYLEALNSVDTVVFDKTGTLTKGVFTVARVAPAGSFDEKELLEYAAYAESFSNHPIALSVVRAYGGEIDKSAVTDFSEHPGLGLRATVGGRRILAGNGRLMEREGVAFSEAAGPGTVVHIAVDGDYAGYLVISDTLKPDSENAVRSLRRLGVRRLVLLTGDGREDGEAVGKALGLDEVHAGLLPDQKTEMLESLDRRKPRGGKLVYVGDGINDAPVLARADVGVAMGGLGSDAAIEAADVVLMTDEPAKLATAIKIAKRTRGIVWQNIVFAIAVKVIVLIMGAGGVATIWEAVFADVGVAVLAILNAVRAMKALPPRNRRAGLFSRNEI